MLFKKNKICIHEWYLVDMSVKNPSFLIDGVVDIPKKYKIVCVKCNKKKKLDDLEFKHFKNTFTVK